MMEHLLREVSKISNSYKMSAVNFNLFKIISLTSNETRVHSAFLAELLNPHGSHGQGAIFLELFIKTCDLEINVDCKSTVVEIEKSIGRITENEGGRIDVFISDKKGKSIIIENKIYAGDQENQLLRYDNFGKGRHQPYNLLYLTLDGKEASKKSCGNQELHYRTISYNEDIISWLKACQEKVQSKPILHEGISHYINLIKYLTGQIINQSMENEIKNILKKAPGNLETAQLIASSINSVKIDVLNSFWESLRTEFKNKGFEILNDRAKGLGDNVKAFIHNPTNYLEGIRILIKEENNFRFYWGADISNFTFHSGFYIREYLDDEILPETNNEYEEFGTYKKSLNQHGFVESNKWWLAYRIEKELNFNNFTPTVCSFVKEDLFEKWIVKIVTEAVVGINILKDAK